MVDSVVIGQAVRFMGSLGDRDVNSEQKREGKGKEEGELVTC